MCVLFGYIKEINIFCITPTVTGTAIAVMMEWPMMYIHVITCNGWASYTQLGFRQSLDSCVILHLKNFRPNCDRINHATCLQNTD